MKTDGCVGVFPAPANGQEKKQFYVFRNPVAWIRGTIHESELIDQALTTWREELPDGVAPSGGIFGRVNYDGGFEFAVCPEIEIVDGDDFLPNEVLVEHVNVSQWKQNIGCMAYCQMVEAAQKRIAAGDIYQVNLARLYELIDPHLDEWELFKHVWALTEAPRSSLFLGQDASVISASPELFLDIQGRRVLTQPIKGTLPRHRDETRDKQNAFELMTDQKEIAELVMITDLERNDLGQVCEFGSVRVKDLVAREAFSHVFHLYSTVEGSIRKGLSHVDVLKACFPGGSITGAPKIKSMEIIEELEPFERGVYTGCLGYFGFNGDSCFNIAIRSYEYRNGKLSFGVGSGITNDSRGFKEYEETQHKAQALLEAYESYKKCKKSLGVTSTGVVS